LQEIKNAEAAGHKMTNTTLQKGQMVLCDWNWCCADEVALLCLKICACVRKRPLCVAECHNNSSWKASEKELICNVYCSPHLLCNIYVFSFTLCSICVSFHTVFCITSFSFFSRRF
jgi:hypothetical protein